VLFGVGVGSSHGLGLGARVALATGTAAAYGMYVWRVVLADAERSRVRRVFGRAAA